MHIYITYNLYAWCWQNHKDNILLPGTEIIGGYKLFQ